MGLLSPYSGGNVGNTTILSALIANIRKRIAGVEIVGLTLDPAETRRRLGIEAFPLAGLSRPYYTLVQRETPKAVPGPSAKGLKIKAWLKRVPFCHRVWRVVRVCRDEVVHGVRAARFVRSLDRVIVAGGGALDESWGGPWGHPWTLFKWSLISRACGVPLLFVSVGKSFLEHPLSRFFVGVALRVARYRSFRDQYSKREVDGLADTSDDPVYPDLAFSFPKGPQERAGEHGSTNGPLVVGLSPIAYCDPRVWPKKDVRQYAAYVRQMADMVKWLIGQGHQVFFFTTDSPDTTTVEEIMDLVGSPPVDGGGLKVLPGSEQQSSESLLQGICGSDLIIASRLHGVILSHLSNTPVLALSFDPKVDAHMQEIGQREYCLPIEHLQFEKLIERFSALRAAREQERTHLVSATVRFSDLLSAQYDRILGIGDSRDARSGDKNQVNEVPTNETGLLNLG